MEAAHGAGPTEDPLFEKSYDVAIHGEIVLGVGREQSSYPHPRTSMYFSSGPRRRLGGAYMLVRAGALGPLFL